MSPNFQGRKQVSKCSKFRGPFGALAEVTNTCLEENLAQEAAVCDLWW